MRHAVPGWSVPDYGAMFSADQLARVREVPHFAEFRYAELDVAAALDYYTRRFVRPLRDFATVGSDTTVADVGTGYGWLAMALAFATDAKVIAVDMDAARLEAGRQIAEILGVADRISWRVGALGDLPLADREADIVYCIEVLEHIHKDPGGVPDLCRCSGDLIVLTTPNQWFPVIAHDTQLPFCHWLPLPWRRVYAKAFGRDGPTFENGNLFWSPYSLHRQTQGFRRVSKWLHYKSYDDFLDIFPYYLPYGRFGIVHGPGRFQGAYYALVARLGRLSHYLLPSLACVLKRQR